MFITLKDILFTKFYDSFSVRQFMYVIMSFQPYSCYVSFIDIYCPIIDISKAEWEAKKEQDKKDRIAWIAVHKLWKSGTIRLASGINSRPPSCFTFCCLAGKPIESAHRTVPLCTCTAWGNSKSFSKQKKIHMRLACIMKLCTIPS